MLKRLFRRAPGPAARADFDAPLAPDTPFCAIGDIHGRVDLLHRLVTDLCDLPFEGPMICLGDAIDRGEQSREVIDTLFALQSEPGFAFFCLKGNHEAMMLDFLDDPVGAGPLWLRNGGLQTLASYDLSAVGAENDPRQLEALRTGLARGLGPEREAWLRGLPLSWRSGNVFVSHAGADPHLPLAKQEDRALLWGGPNHYDVPRQDGTWVVHGHVVVETPTLHAGRIAIDTGAYATGVLTAALVSGNDVHFRTT